MKKFKRILSFFLTLIIVLSCLMITAYADEINSSTPSGTSIVEYSVDPGWKATIPAYVKAADQGQQDPSDYTVTIYDVLLGDQQKLVVTIDYNGILAEENGIQLKYSLYDSDGKIEPEKKFAEIPAGDPDQEYTYTFGAALDEKPKYAGNYLGTVMFNISVEKDEKVYTLEEIEADEHLEGIGKTKSEYVIGQWNEDFTEITVFKNGEDSDGIMKDFGYDEEADSFNSPFATKLKPNYDTGNGFFDMDGNLIDEAFMEESVGQKIKKIVIAEGVKNVGDCLFVLPVSLTDVVIADSVESIGYESFAECTQLENLILGTSLKTIGESAFNNCYSLVNLYIPDNVEIIGAYAFNYCRSLETLTFGDKLRIIGGYAFEDCGLLTDLTIPKKVEEIGDRAFYGCVTLKKLTIMSTETNISNDAFRSNSVDMVIYAYKGSTAEAFAQANGYTFIALEG